MANTTVGEHSVENLPSSKELPSFFGPPREWDLYNSTFSRGYGYSELIAISPKTSNPISLNYSIVVRNESVFTLPDGRNYTNSVGVLGLGPQPVNSPDEGNPIDGEPTLLEQLKASGKISSSSFGMHMGSAKHDQPGSLVLGGYEQNRVLGNIGIFNIDDGGTPHIFLLDIILDTEVGGSPFNESKIGSVYQGLGNNSYAANYTKYLGGTHGSALVALSPSLPYIYLPQGTCETASQYLPVTWDEDIGLYIWNQNDPQYVRIVNSSAYLGFIFADRDASNITIKVPFRLLNLTLSPPIVDLPTPYFPCKPFTRDWPSLPLGRAFLQAAFYGANFDTQTTFIGQGPGPDMDMSVVNIIRPEETTILSNSIASFEESWSSHWTVLTPATESSSSKSGLSAAATGGIVVGSTLGGLVLICGAGILFWKRRIGQTRPFQTTEYQSDDENLGLLGAVIELDASPSALDKSDPLPHECECNLCLFPFQPGFEAFRSPSKRWSAIRVLYRRLSGAIYWRRIKY